MKKFLVTSFWTVCATTEVEAEDEDQAIDKIHDMSGLPPDEEYLDGSFEVDGCEELK